MADMKCRFSFLIKDLSEQEIEWIEKFHLLRRDKEKLNEFIPQVSNIFFGDKSFQDIIIFGKDSAYDTWWIYSGDSGDVEHVCDVLMQFHKVHRPNSCTIFSYIEMCEQMRPDSFVGGTVCVLPDDVLIVNSTDCRVELRKKAGEWFKTNERK